MVFFFCELPTVMDPSSLLTVPELSLDAKENAKSGLQWGHKCEYRSTYLNTLDVDESAPLTTRVHYTSTKNFKHDDKRNPVKRSVYNLNLVLCALYFYLCSIHNNLAIADKISMGRYEDVDGAKSIPLPHSRTLSTGLHDTKKFPSHELKKEPIEGSTSKDWTATIKSPRISMRLDDIDGARPNASSNFGPTHCTIHTARSCDPLRPVYSLPSRKPADVPVPRFLRDSMRIDDIDTNTPRKLFLTPRSSRLDTSGMDGADTRARTMLLRQHARQSSDSTLSTQGKDKFDNLRVKVLLSDLSSCVVGYSPRFWAPRSHLICCEYWNECTAATTYSAAASYPSHRWQFPKQDV